MENLDSTVAHRIAKVASAFEEQRSGRVPKSVTVVLSENTLVITLHGTLTPAEKALAKTPEGAAQVQEFHKQMFDSTADSLRQEIKRICGESFHDRHCGAGVSVGRRRARRQLEREWIRQSTIKNGGLNMLVLSRKNQESVVIGGADGFHRILKVTVLAITGGRVRLGFEVDPSVPVHRAEIWERINVSNRPDTMMEDLAAPVA
jgi:carbon storage regulator CsrA